MGKLGAKMKTILIVNGENYWQEFFPDFQIIQIKIQHSQWIIKNNQLYVIYDNQIFELRGFYGEWGQYARPPFNKPPYA